ncbi:Hsp20/alpha crystallin family protein [Devosia sp. ZB163]|uniref:Hsp20/alpha crystallin family protein n=1 Tax=Devosia sp. ZB163 TaxID=3025938 RepID=UPI00235E7202|nr:Hsp20/alpha crystallin family protein [Devosia sp. ZB163]MDC9822660.1 Hsp20/alpha crystallin family protein [Devosia sp. ZB163]
MAELQQDGRPAATNGNGAEPTRVGPTFIPATDIIERSDALVMILDVPGADPETLDVTLDERVLTIAAQSMSTAPEGLRPLYAEYRDGSYERKFVISDQIDRDGIDAVLKNGVLRLTLPKAAQQPSKKISVKLN